jgi:hypothetical protein
MTLYKGRLGLGTTEPEGRLAVLDEPHNLEEFPPRPMTAYKNYFEGHGEFCVSASNYYAPEALFSWKAFDHISSSRWANASTTAYTNGVYNGSTAITTNGGYVGEWIQLEAPYPIKLSHVMVNEGASIGRGPAAGYILGSNNGVEWNVITNFTGKTYTDYQFTAIKASATSAFRYFRMVVTNVTGGTMVDITEIKFFGTREQGQSVLHDGQLTLTKNLTVPRIGPALDADDTPRRDRLVVEYNTSTNPTFEGAVRDTSGRGNDGVFYNASYSAEKALEFDGVSDTIRGTQNIGTGEKILTMAMWIKRIAAVNTYDYVCNIGTSASGQMAGFTINSNKFNFTKYGAQTASTTIIKNGQWYHLVGVYKGGNWTTTNAEIYVDGVKETVTGGTTSVLNLTGNQITFGDSTLYDGTSDFHGSISNFKLYDTALTAEEVKTLYQMGRCDEGHHVVNFSKTRVGIGLGDGEAPQAALDVRGDIIGGCPVYFGATSTAYRYATSTGAIIIFNSLIKQRGGGYDTSTGRFTAPLAGIYRFDFYARLHGSISIYARLRINGSAIPDGSGVQQLGRCYFSVASVMGGFSAIHKLNAGDIVDVIIQESTSARITNQYNGFIGQYISSL